MSFDFKFLGCDWQGLQLGLMGQHQVENCSLALSVLARLSQRDGFSLDEKPMRKALKGARLVGRFDKRQVGEVSVILDGAHNPQKIEAFAGALENAYPNEKFVFLFAVKWDKDFESILALLRPIAKKFVLTTFSGEGQDFKHSSVHPTKIAKSLEKTKFYQYEIEENVQAALKKALNYAGQEKERVVVTGSLYLLGEVYQLL
jgi:dihydrofolate synthase/folylpolyglutamate synthase